MFAYITGKLIESGPQEVVIDVQGIGYRIFVPVNLLSQLPQVGNSIKLHTSFVIRENFQALYGFLSQSERLLFDTLINLNGVGPKLALSVIGHLPLESLREAVTRKDLTTVSRVPGIGKKMAERMVIELRDKLPALFSKEESQERSKGRLDSSSFQLCQDATSALMNLGYSQPKAQKALEVVLEGQPSLNLPNLIKEALKVI